MFLKFKSQDERSKYGGTCFIELQFCLLPSSSTLEDIMEKHVFWRDDSLYIHGDSPIYSEYKDIFGAGTHYNLTEGLFDYYGITYYKNEQIDAIIDRACRIKPKGYELLTEWLEEAKKHNGFYILGL